MHPLRGWTGGGALVLLIAAASYAVIAGGPDPTSAAVGQALGSPGMLVSLAALACAILSVVLSVVVIHEQHALNARIERVLGRDFESVLRVNARLLAIAAER